MSDTVSRRRPRFTNARPRGDGRVNATRARRSTGLRLRGLAAGAVVLAAALVAPTPAMAAPTAPAVRTGPSAQDATVVRTDAGRLRGEVTAEGHQFLGVPFAEPPVGALRWKAPRTVRPWQGVRTATDFGNRCVQTSGWDPGYEHPSYTEDCLYLNVYAPHDAAQRPVMVWLHGGGLTAGAGEDIVPDTFARQTGAVVVTVNYRLGAMGFLATDGLAAETDDGVSGNYGMLDQQAALRWVRSNIGRFGGDPARVTIAGESAGGRSVCTQMASPSSKGLYRAGIVESGAYGDCSARTRQSAAADGADFTRQLGCSDVACLRGKPAKDVLEAQGGRNWGPVVGGSFLPVQPFEAYAKGAAARVPVLNGANSDEGTLTAFSMFDLNGTPLTAEQYPAVLNGAFGQELGRRVLERYPLSGHPSPSLAFAAAVGDERFACPALRLDRKLASRGPVYAYEFADRTSPAFASLRNLDTDFPFGATHVNEVQYLFKHFGLRTPLNAEQRVLARQMVQYWGSFIRGDAPRADGQPTMPDQRTRPGLVLSLKTASAGGNTLSATVYREHRCDLWDSAPGG